MQRHAAFAVFVTISLIAFWRAIDNLLVYSIRHESCSHIVLVPLISAYLLFAERRQIFSGVCSSGSVGIIMILLGVALYWTAIRGSIPWQGNTVLSLETMALVLVWTGGFLWTYGLAPARAAIFPLLFLLLMVPLPDKVLASLIHALQQGSTEVSYLLFRLVDIPVLRQGFVLSVPNITIQVAAECSGIRSSLALFLTCLLAARLFLRTRWKMILLVSLAFPLAIIKNGIRIVTLTLLSIYVDPGFLNGRLHHEGGFVFFLVALLMVVPMLLLLVRSENRRRPVSSATKQGKRVAAASATAVSKVNT